MVLLLYFEGDVIVQRQALGGYLTLVLVVLFLFLLKYRFLSLVFLPKSLLCLLEDFIPLQNLLDVRVLIRVLLSHFLQKLLVLLNHFLLLVNSLALLLYYLQPELGLSV